MENTNLSIEEHAKNVKKAITTLAKVNAKGETEILNENEIEIRRIVVNALEKIGVIEYDGPKELGKFMFTGEESQNIYLEAYNAAKS